MPAYEANNLNAGTPNQQNLSSSYKTLLEVRATTSPLLRRIFIFEVGLSFDGTPANNSITADISRITGNGTATAGNISACDSADGASASTVLINDTAEPTYTGNSSVWTRAINQQISFIWGAMGAGSQLISPATNNNGFGIRVKSAAYTGTGVASIKFED